MGKIKLDAATAIDLAARAAQQADGGGILQPRDLVPIFPGQPKRHTNASLRTVCEWLSEDCGGAYTVDELIESTW